MKEQQNQLAFDAVFKVAKFKNYVLKCRVKQERMPESGDLRSKVTVLKLENLNYKKETNQILEQLAAY
jgi:hypothetical protein